MGLATSRRDRSRAATARPVDGVLAAGDEFTCRVRMVRLGPYLVVNDNHACGGANVSFSGVHRRKS